MDSPCQDDNGYIKHGGEILESKIQPMSYFRGLKCPNVLREFPVQKVGTERVPKVQIYLHNKTIASKYLVK